MLWLRQMWFVAQTFIFSGSRKICDQHLVPGFVGICGDNRCAKLCLRVHWFKLWNHVGSIPLVCRDWHKALQSRLNFQQSRRKPVASAWKWRSWGGSSPSCPRKPQTSSFSTRGVEGAVLAALPALPASVFLRRQRQHGRGWLVFDCVLWVL